ncbi:MAG: hypothetical protein U0Y10_25465 [Spirosomataceae bacterium]
MTTTAKTRLATQGMLFVSLAFVTGVRAWRLEQVGLTAYDIVRNYEVIQQVASGNFSSIFNHLSTPLYLLYSPIYQAFGGFLSLEYCTILFSVLALWRWQVVLQRAFGLSVGECCAFILLAGTSTILTDQARSIAVEPLSLWLCAEWLGLYWGQTTSSSTQRTHKAWVVMSVLICLNYKALLLLPTLVVVNFFTQKPSFPWKEYLTGLLWVSLGQLTVWGTGVLLGANWKSFLGTWHYILFRPEGVNPWKQVVTFQADFFFYLHYLADFESIILLIGLTLFAYNWWRSTSKIHQQAALVWFVVVTWLGMSLLSKAPRGLTFAYPLLYGLALVGWREVLRQKWAFILVMTLGLCSNFYHLQQTIFQYQPTRYPQVAVYLKQHHIHKIALTVGIHLKPFLEPNIETSVVRFESDLPALHAQGFEYVLVDDYHRIAGANVFERLRQQQPVLALPEPMLLMPILYLEHCEFTGLSYSQALDLQHCIAQEPYQLRLVRLPANLPLK